MHSAAVPCSTAGGTPRTGATPRRAPDLPGTWLLPVSACEVLALGGETGAQRWDGSRWRPLLLPFPADDIDAEVATGATDVWFATGYDQTLALRHWDGRRWSSQPPPPVSFGPDVVPGRSQAPGRPWLAAMSASGPGDVWAVGGATSQGRKPVAPGIGDVSGPPLIEHWDGTRWQQVAPPASWQSGNSGDYYRATAVQAGGPDDVWLVGQRDTDSPFPGPAFRLARWDGHAWRDAPAPPRVPAAGPVNLVVNGPDDVWTCAPGTGSTVEHFDGTAWRSVPLPADLVGPDAEVFQVVADGAGGVWVSTQSPATADPRGEHGRTGGLLHRTATSGWSLAATPAPPRGWLAAHPPTGAGGTPWQDSVTVEVEARLPTSNVLWFRVERYLLPAGTDPDLVGAEDTTNPSGGGTLTYTLSF